jgi:hypothetical protein
MNSPEAGAISPMANLKICFGNEQDCAERRCASNSVPANQW